MAERRDRAPRLDQPREKRRQFITRPEALTSEAFGVLSEKFARYMGTAYFLIGMTFFVLLWVVWNLAAPQEWRFDNYPFIFLTLMLSLQASYAAPLILLAQNRQADRDRVMLEQDRNRDERNLADTEFLTREVAALRIAMRDSATRDFVRGELRDLLDEMEERGLVVGRLTQAENAGSAGSAGSAGNAGNAGSAGGAGNAGSAGGAGNAGSAGGAGNAGSSGSAGKASKAGRRDASDTSKRRTDEGGSRRST